MKIITTNKSYILCANTITGELRILRGVQYDSVPCTVTADAESYTLTGTSTQFGEVNARLSAKHLHASHVEIGVDTFSAPSVHHPRVGRSDYLDAAMQRHVSPSVNCGVAVYYEDNTIAIHSTSNSPDMFTVASARKSVTLYELARQVDAGIVSLDSVVEITSGMVANGGGVIKEMTLPASFTIRRLAQYMIENSDNTASEYLRNLVGTVNETKLCRALGLDNIHPGELLGMVGDSEPTFDGTQWLSSGARYYTQTLSDPQSLMMVNVLGMRGGLFTTATQAFVSDMLKLPNDVLRARGGVPKLATYAGKPGYITGSTKTRPQEDVSSSQPWPGVAADSCFIGLAGKQVGVTVLTEGESAVAGSSTVRNMTAAAVNTAVSGVGVSKYNVIMVG